MSSTSILDLPPEVLTHLFIFLPAPSRAILAHTCRHFHHAAEQAIYTSINLHPKVDHQHARQRYPELLERATEHVGDQEDGFYVDMELTFLIYRYETQRLVQRVREALLASPARTASVRRMSIYVVEGLGCELLELLGEVRSTLYDLDIEVHDEVSFLHDDETDGEWPETSHDFWAATQDLPPMTQLRRLKADIGSRELHDLSALLKWAPSLVSLDLSIATGFDVGHASVLGLTREWPRLETLQILRLKDVEAHFLSFIAPLVDHAPNLRALAIHSLFEENERIPKAIAQVLQQKRALRYFEWVDVSRMVPLVEDGAELLANGFESLETLMQGGQPWSPMRVPSRWRSHELLIPPNVKHYMFAVMANASNAHRPGHRTQVTTHYDPPGDWATNERVQALARLKSLRCVDVWKDQTPRSDAAWRDDDFGLEIRTVCPPGQDSRRSEQLVCFLPRYGLSARAAQFKLVNDVRGVEIYSGSARVPEQNAPSLYSKLRMLSDDGRYDDELVSRASR